MRIIKKERTDLFNRFVGLAIFIILIQFTMGTVPVEAKAGGVGSDNITTVLAGTSQNPPTCGIQSGCHNLLPEARGLELNVTVSAPATLNLNEAGTITVTAVGNETIDEIGFILMNLTAADGTGTWSQADNVLVTAVNETAGGPNYYESTGSVSFTYTIIATETGLKQLTIQGRGGLATPGTQNWHTLNNFNITVIGVTMVSVNFGIDFIGNHYECPQDSCWITVDNGGVASFVNCTHDNEPEHQLCANCTLVQAQFIGFEPGFHTVSINTSHGNETIRFKVVDPTYYEPPFGIEKTTGVGNTMQIELYLFFLALGFLTGLYALNKKEPATMFVSSLFFLFAGVESSAVTILSNGIEYTYSYYNYIVLWYGFSIVGIVLTVFFILNQDEFTPGKAG